MADPLSTRFSQRNLANTAFIESFVSGSNIVYGTDASGSVSALTQVPLALSSAFATSASYALSSSYALNAGTLLTTGSTYPITSSWSIYSVFSETASYVTNLDTTTIISPDEGTFVTATNGNISASVSNLEVFTLFTQSVINSQNGTASLELHGRFSGSNVNVGVPVNDYPWGQSLIGSYFSTWTSDTNVSDILRFFAGAFSSSYPIPSPNTKYISGITTTNTNAGSTITINGRVPTNSTNIYINYLQPLGWAVVGSTIFSGYTFKNGVNYGTYASTVAGSTTVSSSLGSNAFNLGLLNNGNINTVYLSGSFTLTFASSSAGTVNYNFNTTRLQSQSSENSSTSVSSPIAVKIIPSANSILIPPVYQDGYFSNLTGSTLTNTINLSSVSSSGIYTIIDYIGLRSGSSTYSFFTGSTITQYYTPLVDGNFTQTISSPGSNIVEVSFVSRSLSGAPYLTSGSTYKYNVTSSGAFDPLYYNGTISTVNLPSNALNLSTSNTKTSVISSGQIQTSNTIKSSDYSTFRSTGTYPHETDVIVFDLNIGATGTGSNASSSGSTFSSFTVNTSTYNRAGSASTIGSQTINVHTAGTFGQPESSGSLLYYGRPQGYSTSSLTFSLVPNTEQFLDETYRLSLADDILYWSGNYVNSLSYLPISSLQVKPGYLVNPGGQHRYWYPSGYGTTFKYYVRHFKSISVVNSLKLTLTGNTTLVGWDDISTSNSISIALIFESGNRNVYSRCRLFDVSNLSQNLIQPNISPTDISSNGINPFGENIDLYGNSGTGASNSSGVIIFPTRAADGADLDNNVSSKDELYVFVRYNGSPTPLTSIKIEKNS